VKNTGLAHFFGISRYVDLYRLQKMANEIRKSEKKRESQKKIFVIGFNKTGTTSVDKALEELGYKRGNQKLFEYLSKGYWDGKGIDRIVEFCKYYDYFQDLPFSTPEVYKLLDKAFPGSKFILTVRDSDDQWLVSMKRYYGKSVNPNNPERITEADLKNSFYRYKGFMYDFFVNVYGKDFFSEEWKNVYSNHIEDVKKYFKDRPDDLLCINVADDDSYLKMCVFLGKEPMREKFGWFKKTA